MSGLTTKDKNVLIEMICKKQNEMILSDATSYQTDEYTMLEQLKVKIRSCGANNG